LHVHEIAALLNDQTFNTALFGDDLVVDEGSQLVDLVSGERKLEGEMN
jgi:hypothetical protein